jgi:hypothetical protein
MLSSRAGQLFALLLLLTAAHAQRRFYLGTSGNAACDFVLQNLLKSPFGNPLCRCRRSLLEQQGRHRLSCMRSCLWLALRRSQRRFCVCFRHAGRVAACCPRDQPEQGRRVALQLFDPAGCRVRLAERAQAAYGSLLCTGARMCRNRTSSVQYDNINVAYGMVRACCYVLQQSL